MTREEMRARKIAQDITVGEHTLTFAGINFVEKNDNITGAFVNVVENYRPIYISLNNQMGWYNIDDLMLQLGVNECDEDVINTKANGTKKIYINVTENRGFKNARFRKPFKPTSK